MEEAERKAEEAAQAVKNVQYHHADYDEALAPRPRRTAPRPRAAPAEPAQPFVARRPEGRPQRPVPLRVGQEVQELPRQAGLRR